MAKKAKRRTGRKTDGDGGHPGWNTFNNALNTLEKQAGWAYTQIRHSLPKNWDKKIGQLTSRDIVTMARKKRNQIAKEVKYYADGIVDTISRADFLSDKNRLVKEARKNLDSFLKKIQKSGVAHKAKDMAADKGAQVLSLLNFPTRKEVARLNGRLGQLEKQLKSLSSSARR